ncbi:hypothetical protein T484DRAFT_3331763 [Baffinella frigidus]|nr:hypothetical protein T484DRAFT_3331763 [Cryptophyta sp. CCMP2293]
MLAYYPLEHLCWANAVAPKLFSINAELCSRVSCVFWTLWIVTDLFCVWRRFRELRRLEDKLRKDGSLTPSMQAAILRSRKALQFHTLRLLLFLPNAIHWTLPSGHRWGMPGTAVQVLGLAEGLVGTYTLAQGFSVANPAA